MIGYVNIKKEDKRIKRCPICDRYPRVYRDPTREGSWMGTECIIACRGFLGLFKHLEIYSFKASWEPAYEDAVSRWNFLADEMVSNE